MGTVIERYPVEKYDTRDLAIEQSVREQMPGLLYYRGDISLLQGSVVAVIGSREISERGKAISRNIAKALCKREKIVLNGLALGCDAAALDEVVECGGKGIAVMPCGLDQIYPKTNQKLAEEILEKGGCLISEYPEGIRPRKETFVARDRLQALFSSLVIVVESKEGSGTWHTVEFARRYRIPVACYVEKNGIFSRGNEMLVQSNKAYALRDNEGMEYILELSDGRWEQQSLPIFFNTK
ncbi:MAG: DNA-protecting protein DprA [Butyrivibrio sp.]|nr:DNA-protecting protein DprA [Muribaculum sp.]MCM1551785.1 DNA-protecting protein DprA [Butyrivibrio sp.]